MIRRLNDQPIRRKLTIMMTLSSAAGLLLAGATLIGYTWSRARTDAAHDLETTTRIVASNTSAALVFNDVAAATEILAALRVKSGVELACLYLQAANGYRQLFASYAIKKDGSCSAAPFASETQGFDKLIATVPVELHGEHVGTLSITQNLEGQRDALGTQVGMMLGIIGASFLFSLMIAWVAQRTISQPILRLTQTARKVSEARDYTLRAEVTSRDEVGQLVGDFNHMLEQIARRDAEVLQARDQSAREAEEKALANRELEAAMTALREAQKQLVESEKMASLGGLVAGVAHEINTPVGIGVTAASTLESAAKDFRQKYQSNTLRRSEMDRFVALAEESTNMILKNLQRAADLIHSFKQVAVDHTSGEWRRFVLKDYIEEILMSLRPRLRKAEHTLTLDCPANVSIESNPGALAQILTNFVNNSLMHAFEPGQKGTMSIAVAVDKASTVLRYRDDGRGIPPENLKRIFDPFFTTKRGAGGSGLGLHIVYNLVTQMLHGTIAVHSEPGRGAEFVVRIPNREDLV
jgi:signal transduction histidine kinase